MTIFGRATERGSYFFTGDELVREKFDWWVVLCGVCEMLTRSCVNELGEGRPVKA